VPEALLVAGAAGDVLGGADQAPRAVLALGDARAADDDRPIAPSGRTMRCWTVNGAWRAIALATIRLKSS
jgi:hypothetical protein